MNYKMSMHSVPSFENGDFFGYGVAFNEMRDTLNRTYIHGEKLDVYRNDPGCKLQLHVGGGKGMFYPHQYKIQMAQWESTLAPAKWAEASRGYDEFWTANPFGASALIAAGVDERKVHVYEHGVDSSIWTKKYRQPGDKIRFLHIDSGNLRKRSDVVMRAFKAAFGDSKHHQLTLKYSYKDVYADQTYKRSKVDWSTAYTLERHGEWDGNIRRIYEIIDLKDLVALYHHHDVLVYPTEGEGFGLIPLQALITGMPVISTGIWCSYEKYLQGNVIESKMDRSTFIKDHFPGNSIIPSVESTMELMLQVANNIESQSKLFYDQADIVAEEYSWDNQTIKTLDSLIDRVGLDMFL